MALATRFLCGISVFCIDYVTIIKKTFKFPYPIPNLGCIKDKETIKIYLKHEENKKRQPMPYCNVLLPKK